MIKSLLLWYFLSCTVATQAQSENAFTKKLSLSKLSTPRHGLSTFNPGKKNDHIDLALAKRAIQSIDSISHTTGAPSHFAWIYSKVMANLEIQLKNVDSAGADFIRKFEIAFADYFLQACIDDRNGDLSSASPWKNLFSNPTAHPLKLTIMGISAHVNGDMWQAFVTNFPGEEIRLHKKVFLGCQASVAKVYFALFDSVAENSWYLKFMRSFTKGLVKNLGERIIYKWRRRQVNLAILYSHDPERFNRKLEKINRKKEKTDQLLLNRLSLIIPKNGVN